MRKKFLDFKIKRLVADLISYSEVVYGRTSPKQGKPNYNPEKIGAEEERMLWKKVVIGKVDIDTCGAGYILEINRTEKIEVAKNGQASSEDLTNNAVVCIEVGGSGRILDNNWDHHDPQGPTESATKQAFMEIYKCHIGIKEITGSDIERHRFPSLVKYIDQLDVVGPRSLPSYGKLEFPGLSDVFAGMCLVTRDPVEQFHRGIEILRQVVEEGQDPFGTIRGFNLYAAAKAQNNAQVAKAGESAQWATTKSGRKLGYLETDFYGAPGVLYGLGAEVVVAYSPKFGNPPVPKFTIGGNDVRVDSLLAKLNNLEKGWGGPPTGTIIGSPREGSKLSLAEVVDIVSTNL